MIGRPAGGMTRALERALGRCAGLLPPGRRGWADAVRAEAAEVPAGLARLGWVAGGMWLVAREAQMMRRIACGLGTMAVTGAAVALVAGTWPGVAAAGWDKARLILLVALLAACPGWPGGAACSARPAPASRRG